MMINKNQFRITHDKKLLRKIGKQWVTVSALTLALLGGGTLATSVVTHADTVTNSPVVEANDTNSVKKQLNSNLDKAYQASQSASSNVSSPKASSASANSVNMPSNIESKATNMYRGLMLNAVNNSNSPSSSSASVKSSIASSSSMSASAKPSFNSAYQSYMAKMNGIDNEVAKDNDSNAENNNNSINKAQSVNNKKVLIETTDNGQTTMSDNHWIYNSDNNKYYGSDAANFTQTGSYDGLNYKYDSDLYAVEFTGGTAQSNLSNFIENAPTNISQAYSIKFGNDVDISKVTDMTLMFHSDANIYSLDLGNNFNTSNVTSMNNVSGGMFSNDSALQFINLGNKFDTTQITTMAGMFSDDPSLQTLNLGNKFSNEGLTISDTYGNEYEHTIVNVNDMFYNDSALRSLNFGTAFNRGDYDYNMPYTSNSYSNRGVLKNDNHSTMLQGASSLQTILNSPYVPIAMSGPHMYQNLMQTDYKGKEYTLSSVDTNTSYKNNYTRQSYIPTDMINYQYNGKTLATQKITAKYNSDNGEYSDINVTKDNASNIPSNYHLLNSNNTVPCDSNVHVVAIAPTLETDTVNYIDNGKEISSTINGNYGSDVKSAVDSHVPSNYHAVSGDTGTFTPNGKVNVQIVPNQTTDTISYTYNHQTIGTSSVTGNTVEAQGANDTSININPSNAKNIPPYYHLANNNNQVLFDGKPKNIAVTPDQATDTISYTYNGHTLSSTTITGNNSNAKNASDTSDTITPNNLPAELPNGYQLVNTSNKIPYDGEPHAIAIEPTPSYFNVIEYTDSKGNPIGDTTAYGQKGTNIPNSIIENDIPKGYQVAQPLPVKFTDKNVVKVAVQSDNGKGDMVVGTAYLTLLYKKGNRTDGQVLKLHINGNIGDSDIIINPQDYDRDGYSIALSDKDWHIPFDYNNVKKATNDFSRYNVENTFIYNAQPISINIDYVDTQTGNPVPNTSTQKLSDVAYDSDTIDLEDANSSNGVISINGNNYRLNLPQGYHLAHGNNYITVTANDTYTKKVSNGIGGSRSVRMPLMKLTLGITPHLNKPTSNSSVTPVKPSSASSVTPRPISSASTEPSSASVVPSSAGQSVAPNSVASSSMVIPSSAASVASVTPSVVPSSSVSSTASSSSVALASVSVKPSSTNINPVSTIARPVTHHTNHKRIAKKPVTHRISHKKMAKHDTQRLNYQVTKATEQLNTVERHMETRKAIIRKATHAKRVIEHAKKRLHHLHHNKRHVAHALRRITRNKVAIKHAKRTVRTAKQARPKFVHAKAASTEPTTDKSAAPSVKAPTATPRAKPTAVHTNRKKLPQTSEATDHAGIVAIILMIMSVILASFDKAFGREHNE